MKITITDTKDKNHVYLGNNLDYKYGSGFISIQDKDGGREIGLFNRVFVKKVSVDMNNIQVYKQSEIEVDLT